MTPLDRIRDQVTNNTVVLYMKGTPQFPQCGFSSRAAQVLQASGLNDFLAVNVLADPEIFENLKYYANWPTFQQLYNSRIWTDGICIRYGRTNPK